MTNDGNDRVDWDQDYVTCWSCGFMGTVLRGVQRCPDCRMGFLHPMNETERAGYDAGTLTHSEDCFDNLCSYTGVYGDMRLAALKAKE
jgi:hypothetical protein